MERIHGSASAAFFWGTFDPLVKWGEQFFKWLSFLYPFAFLTFSLSFPNGWKVINRFLLDWYWFPALAMVLMCLSTLTVEKKYPAYRLNLAKWTIHEFLLQYVVLWFVFWAVSFSIRTWHDGWFFSAFALPMAALGLYLFYYGFGIKNNAEQRKTEAPFGDAAVATEEQLRNSGWIE